MNLVRRKRKPKVDLIPLVDMMCYLIFFFMIFTSFRTHTTGMPLELPRAATPQELASEIVIISVDSSGGIYIGEEKVELSAIPDRVKKALERDPDELFAIKADKSVTYESLISIIDAVRIGGGVHLALAVERATSGSGGSLR